MGYTLEENGFQVIRDVVSSEIIKDIHDFLLLEMNNSIGVIRNFHESFKTGDIVKHIDYIFNNNDRLQYDSAKLSLASGLYPLQVRLSPILRKIFESDALVMEISKALKTNHIKMHMPPAARFVMPNNVHGMVPAHNDASYNQHVDDFIVVWLPLTPIGYSNNEAGGVAFYNYQIKDVAALGVKRDVYWLPQIDVSGYDEIHLEIMPGDVFIFNKHVIHKSLPNNSSQPRLSIDYRFFPGHLYSTKHCYDLLYDKIIEPNTSQEHIYE